MERRSLNPIFVLVTALVVVGLGVALYLYLLANGPKSVQASPEVVLPSVEFAVIQRADHILTLRGQGDVSPARVTEIRAEVGGMVEDVSARFVTGGTFQKGERLLALGREDLEARVIQADARLAETELAFQQESKRAAQARRDWDKLGGGREADPLVLREPQLAVARTQITSARAALDQAKRDVDRSEIVAPYDCLITSRAVDLGGMLSPGGAVATIESVEDREVRVPLSLEDYGYLERADGEIASAEATLTGTLGVQKVSWKGRVLRSEGRIDPQSRTAHIIVSVEPNNEGLKLPPSGMFLNVSLRGQTLESVSEVPRVAFSDRNQVLVLTDSETLELRDVTVVRRERESSFVSSGLETGERLITTPVDTPVDGMQVQTSGEDAP